LALSAGEG